MVLIVGAGPAGATAALTLARAGIPVTLLDRASFPRNKPCGGGITIRALARFPWLERALETIPTHRVARMYLEGPDGDSVVIDSRRPAVLLIRRVEFDAMLVRLAVDAGATLVPGVDIVRASERRDGVVLESRDGRRFDAAVVIAADGVHSIVARRLGLNPGWPSRSVALDMMEETSREVLTSDPDTLWVSYGYAPSGATGSGRRAPEGYAYIFPKRDHVNIGVGYVLDHFRSEVQSKPYDLQREFVSQLRHRRIVTGESVRRNFTPFIIPVGGPLKRPAHGRVLLAGDAGGFVNGLTAEGIYYAMASGQLAAQAVVNTAPEHGIARLAREYCQACRREFGAELRDSVLLQRFLFSDRRRIARLLSAASRDESWQKMVVDYAAGMSTYTRLRRRIVFRAPTGVARILAAQMWSKVLRRSRTLTASHG
jgi:geranylgeranyl reductase family protein